MQLAKADNFYFLLRCVITSINVTDRKTDGQTGVMLVAMSRPDSTQLNINREEGGGKTE